MPNGLNTPYGGMPPFLSQSGLGTEAISVLMSLVASGQVSEQDIYISHSGDTPQPSLLNSLSTPVHSFLTRRQHPQLYADEYMPLPPWSPARAQQQQHALKKGNSPAFEGPDYKKVFLPGRPWDTRHMVAICHNWYECWRMPGRGPSTMASCPCPLSGTQAVYRVARTMFETSGLPPDFAAHANALDEVWVPTQFNVETFAAAGVDRSKLHVVPEALDTRDWDPAKYQPLPDFSALGLQPVFGEEGGQHKGKPFVFLSVFKWEMRKGWRELLLAYFKAFQATDNVELIIFTKPFLGSGVNFAIQMQAWAAQHIHLTHQEMQQQLPRVSVSWAQISEDTFRRLYASVGALVVATHGEGWGRPQMEAMAMQLPVITTNWSGPTAFMNDQVGYMVPIDGLVDIKKEGPQFFEPFVGQKWAQPSVVHLAQLMRHVFTHREEARAKGVAARRHIQSHFTPQMLTASVLQQVRRIQGLLAARQQQQHAKARGGWSWWQRQRRGGGGGGGQRQAGTA